MPASSHNSESPPRAGCALVLLALLADVAGCASQSQTAGAAATPARKETGQLAEEFDPRADREDLLLIEPTFAPPITPAAAQLPEASPPATPEQEPDSEISLATLAEMAARVDGDSLATAAAASVYRVQIIALSDESAAQRLAELLHRDLNLPVSVVPDNGLYAVHVGESESPAEARALSARLAEVRGEFADAFVVRSEPLATSEAPADSEALEFPAEGPYVVEEVSPPPQLVRTVGWRVLIKEFRALGDAEAFRRSASQRLRRDDVEIIFHDPWYKVEVGHFRSVEEAHELVAEVKRRGYGSALKVRGEVLVPKEIR